jgi:hypothetical protein
MESGTAPVTTYAPAKELLAAFMAIHGQRRAGVHRISGAVTAKPSFARPSACGRRPLKNPQAGHHVVVATNDGNRVPLCQRAWLASAADTECAVRLQPAEQSIIPA